ncbi:MULTISPECIES: helix-turn-helix transcriptional regulator [unclassified Rathayibacter]|uniref:helix-turn-helix transcriptional regulator n=1 Tax=unclassified Rathayibacter TaxID=2609250 RepID=UPI00188C867B|nr:MULTISPECIES: helix-turn-helix transcriptional regulator [unclassified Rathayibacter]MBF4463181.1 AraC family transcriptional regulator [Rathayibacter sp. VKM Ac-2879]MBF4504582.1 AraC family transcriptional regulator [Rathayibacter sp. VKM Ac-2878]
MLAFTIGAATVIPRPTLTNPASVPLGAGVRAVRLRGAEGVSAVRRSLDLAIEQVHGFRMDLQIASIERVRVMLVSSTPFSTRWPGPGFESGASTFALPVAGSLTMRAGLERVTVARGGLVLSSDEPVVVEAEQAVRFLVLCTRPSPSERARRLEATDPDPVRVGASRALPASSLTAAALALLHGVLAELDIEHPTQADYLHGMVLRLARLLWADGHDSSTEKVGVREMVEAAEEVVRADAADPALDPPGVALRCGVRLRTLQRAIAEERGTTLRDLIIAVRTEEALRLVRAPGGGELPLRDIADRSGFSSPERLRRAIAAHTGLSPSEYRRRRRGDGRATG